MSNVPAVISVRDIEVMANAVAKSKLFGVSTADQAMALMLIAQAEGLHPAIAARDYHIIQGRPALKADAMLARFQQAGGKVEWTSMTDDRVAGKFSHEQGGSVEIDWDMTRAKAAGLGGKDMWKKFPRQMLRARVISEGIRSVFPGVTSGVYTPEEVEDFEKPKDMGRAERVSEPEKPREVQAEVVEELPFKFASSEDRMNWLHNAKLDIDLLQTPEDVVRWKSENMSRIEALGEKQKAWMEDTVLPDRMRAVSQAPLQTAIDDIPGDFTKPSEEAA